MNAESSNEIPKSAQDQLKDQLKSLCTEKTREAYTKALELADELVDDDERRSVILKAQGGMIGLLLLKGDIDSLRQAQKESGELKQLAPDNLVVNSLGNNANFLLYEALLAEGVSESDPEVESLRTSLQESTNSEMVEETE